MVFKQGVLKEEKFKFFSGLILGGLFPYIVIVILGLVDSAPIEVDSAPIEFILIFSLLFFPIILLGILIGMNYLEWYYIFDDRIEVRCPYGIKNSVYYDKVEFIEELKINVYTRSGEKTFYMFNDGRKNNNSFFNLNSCYNKKKFNLRIYKTNRLKNFIQSCPKLNQKARF